MSDYDVRQTGYFPYFIYSISNCPVCGRRSYMKRKLINGEYHEDGVYQESKNGFECETCGWFEKMCVMIINLEL